jgi:plastocyanin domain-containing protein
VLWADIGPLRVSVFTHNLDVVSREQILGIMDTMGPASNRQVFTFQLAADTEIKAVAAPPPVQIELNAEGIQELTLVVTPGGYTPIRFAVRKDLPVRLHFRMIGQVGCGNVLSLPIGTNEMVGATLFSQDETKTLDFTPREVGEFQFYCAHYMFRGIMTVTE